MEYLGVEKYILKFWCAIDKERIDFKTVDWPSIGERFIVFILESDWSILDYLLSRKSWIPCEEAKITFFLPIWNNGEIVKNLNNFLFT